MSIPHLPPATLRQHFGDVDVYLFDQLLRGRVPDGATVLDAGCGGGRNLVYFLARVTACSAPTRTQTRQLPYAVSLPNSRHRRHPTPFAWSRSRR